MPAASPPKPESRRAHVEISLDLAPGEVVRLTLRAEEAGGAVNVQSERLPASGQPSAPSQPPVQGAEPPPVLETSILGGESTPSEQTFGERWRALVLRVEAAFAALQASRYAALTNPSFLAGAALAIYLLTRLVGLVDFPIYFSCDEASNSVLAADLVKNNWRDYDNTLLPTFFKNDNNYGQGFAVYLQVIPYLLAGKTVLGTRLTFVLVTCLGALWLSLILRDIFHLKRWWLGALLLSVTPFWFIISRLGVDYSLPAAFYAGFLYYYLLYLKRSPRYLYAAIVLGALVFYSYTAAQFLIVASGFFFLVADHRYHWQQRRTCLRALGLLALLALPLVRFIAAHPEEYGLRLSLYNNYLNTSIPLVEKIGRVATAYLAGLDPTFWFFPHARDIPRYTMKGYGHISWLALPFTLWGLWLAVRRNRQAEWRALVLALMAAPASVAIVTLNAHRMASILIPLTLLAALGLSAALDWLDRRTRLPEAAVSAVLFVLLALGSLLMTGNALRSGPTWYQNYGLDGMWYGGRQVFAAVQAYQQKNPLLQIMISPNWTFQSENMRRFFLPDSSTARMEAVDTVIVNYTPRLDRLAFVMTPEDYGRAEISRKFAEITVDQVLPYPNGKPGFYFARLRYRDDIEAVFAEERAQRRRLREGVVVLGGEQVKVAYSPVDGDSISPLFDGNRETLVKTLEANPFIVKLEFPTPRTLTGVSVRAGQEVVQVLVRVYGQDAPAPFEYTREAEASPGVTKEVALTFPAVNASIVQIEIKDVFAAEPANVHAWEITLQP